jgi:hypothetical protein
MNGPFSKSFDKRHSLPLRIALGVTAFLLAAALFRYLNIAFELHLFERSAWLIALFLTGITGGLLIALTALGLFVLTFTSRQLMLFEWMERGMAALRRFRSANLWIFGAGIALYAAAELTLNALVPARYLRYLQNAPLQYLLFGLLVLFGAAALRSSGSALFSVRDRPWSQYLAAASLVTASGYVVFMFLSQVSTHPFSLAWSEASRYFYASLFLSDRLYGFHIPPSVLHPTRYLMQAVPFLISGSPIWLHRLWQVFLWLGTSTLTAYLLQRRLSIPQAFQRWTFSLWVFLFLLIAPIYYHLQIIPILVVWGFDRSRSGFWKSLLVVLIASLWAGVSRVNWFPMPGLLAACLYLLEQPYTGRRLWQYFWKPAIWVVLGTLVAVGSQALYRSWSGNPVDQFNSSFSSDLLWYRLLPNPTYPLGVLLSSILIFSPLVLLFINFLRQRSGSVHHIRLLGLGSILLAIYLGALVVSIKIGGGSNLHNLDGFLILMLVCSGYIFFDRIGTDGERPTLNFQTAWPITVLGILMPVLFSLGVASIIPPPGRQETRAAIAMIQEAVDEATIRGGQVLFITERQLEVFNVIHGGVLVPDYEKVFLMEMAMGNNENYLETFYAKLRDHRFALIVSEPLKIVFKGSGSSFGEENDVWVSRVAEPILCYYQAELTLKEFQTELLLPKPGNAGCP